MRSVAEHLAGALALVAPLPSVEVGLADALGLVAAADVRSRVTLPPWDNSSMDGYAVVVADVGHADDAPVELPVVGDLPAGVAPTRPLEPGTAVRIMTGAPVPAGTGAVVQVEWTDGGAERVVVRRAVREGQNVRRAGEDVTEGDVVVEAGAVLTARHVGLLAATGHASISVHARPRVAVLSTGSEIVAPGGDLGPGQIFDSNSWSLAASVVEAGGVPHRVGGVPDDAASVTEVLAEAAAGADLVVTSGGVSAGAYDVVKEVLRAAGGVEFVKVGMQPGMPQGLGVLTSGDRSVPIITLPGNPVSTFVSFEVFVRPVVRTLLGHSEVHRPTVSAVVAEGWSSPAGKRQVARVRLDRSGPEPVLRLVGRHGSHLVAELAGADALAEVPEDVTEVRAGDRLVCRVLDGAR